MNRRIKILFVILFVLLSVPPSNAQGDRVFTVPLSDLQNWSKHFIVSMNAKILGHSKVHTLKSDCEMHFGAQITGYKGDPTGWVLEPMNLCLEPFLGKPKHSNLDWTSFGDSLKGKIVKVEGVPRLWPEHLQGSGDASNPDHAVELHPLIKLTSGSQKYDFTKFIYVPDGFPGGVSPDTAHDILKNTTVTVTETNGNVEIDFNGGRIGNFTTLQVRISRTSIEEVGGSHRMDGEVVFARNDTVPVRLVSVAKTHFDKAIIQFKTSKRKTATFDVLVLFSLSPEVLVKAAQKSHGSTVDVQKSIQLIVYGEFTDE